MNKISIIVPVYNVENYIKDCIESIMNQTHKNIEIILVDDGSTDTSGKICDKYKDVDNRIKVIHKENSGLSEARNFGLEAATGKYIMFCDSDDYYELNACEILLKEMENKNADMVIGNYINTDDKGVKWSNPIFDIKKYKNFKLSIKDYSDSFYIMNSSVCNKIFRRDFIEKNNMRFIPHLPAEDAIFTTLYFMKSKKVYYISDVIYNYRQRANTSSISNNCSLKYFKGINEAYKIIYNNFLEHNEVGFYRYFYAKSMTYILYKFIDSNLLTDEERIEILSDMRWFYKLSISLNVPACQKSLSLLINNIIDGRYKETLDICKVIADIRSFMTKEMRENMSKPQKELYEEILKYNN